MKQAIEKTVEVVVSDQGVTVAVRPEFPFLAESFHVAGPGILHVLWEGRRLVLSVQPDDTEAIEGQEQILLAEFPAEGGEPLRETILMAS